MRGIRGLSLGDTFAGVTRILTDSPVQPPPPEPEPTGTAIAAVTDSYGAGLASRLAVLT